MINLIYDYKGYLKIVKFLCADKAD